MSRAGKAFLVLGLVLALGACEGGREANYRPNGRTVEIDPATGDTIITQFWKYDNGATAVTFKRIPRGNSDRRNEAPVPEPVRD
jgi:hypothetical protein